MHARTDPVPFVRRVRQAQIGGGRKTYFIIIYFIRVFKRRPIRPIGCRPFIRYAVLAWTTAFHTIRIDKYVYMYKVRRKPGTRRKQFADTTHTRGRPRKFIISNLFIYLLFFLLYWFIFDLYVCFTFSLVISIVLLYPVPDKIAVGSANAYVIRKKNKEMPVDTDGIFHEGRSPCY